MWTRIHARGLAASHGDLVRALVGRTAFLELAPPVLSRALEPFPCSVRTLDALHLASMEFLLRSGQAIELATYDERLRTAATALGVPIRQI
jgi:predicted nucleic acid-binding protein